MAPRLRTAGLVVLATLTLAATAAVWALRGAPPPVVGSGRRDVDPEFASAPDRRRLAWIDRAGRLAPVAAPPRGYAYPRLSPDGRLIAIDIRDGQRGLWMWDGAAATLSPLATGRTSAIAPVWSRSGTWLLFARSRGIAPGLFRLDIGGASGPPGPPDVTSRRLPAESSSLLMPTALTPDDRHAIMTTSVASGLDLLAVDLRGSGTPVPLVTTAADDLNGDLSPDGQWLAYQSRTSGQFEVWAKRWGTAGPGTQVTSTGGTRPVWTRGGQELIYLTHDGDMMALATHPGPSALSVGAPQRLFTADIYRDLVGRTFDVSPDGERFLVVIGH